jgi:hypothetical protein
MHAAAAPVGAAFKGEIDVSLSVLLLNVVDPGGLQRLGLRGSSGELRWTFDRLEWCRSVGFGRRVRWKFVRLECWKSVEWERWKSVRRRWDFDRFEQRSFGKRIRRILG